MISLILLPSLVLASFSLDQMNRANSTLVNRKALKQLHNVAHGNPESTPPAAYPQVKCFTQARAIGPAPNTATCSGGCIYYFYDIAGAQPICPSIEQVDDVIKMGKTIHCYRDDFRPGYDSTFSCVCTFDQCNTHSIMKSYLLDGGVALSSLLSLTFPIALYVLIL